MAGLVAGRSVGSTGVVRRPGRLSRTGRATAGVPNRDNAEVIVNRADVLGRA
jgi:hypothetical protein